MAPSDRRQYGRQTDQFAAGRAQCHPRTEPDKTALDEYCICYIQSIPTATPARAGQVPMQAAPLPDNEAQRLAALYALLILDTPPEERFDRIAAFAAAEFDVPIVLVTLLDTDRQWFKARIGLDACETGRDMSFCGHAILREEIMVVPDALDDPRFADNPLVTGAPFIRFYAGAPLQLASGERLGTLCLIDRRPRTLDALELGILSTLRDLAVMELSGSTGDDHG
jgi:GAF domain-containing protein